MFALRGLPRLTGHLIELSGSGAGCGHGFVACRLIWDSVLHVLQSGGLDEYACRLIDVCFVVASALSNACMTPLTSLCHVS
jgi:hypothetical protein